MGTRVRRFKASRLPGQGACPARRKPLDWPALRRVSARRPLFPPPLPVSQSLHLEIEAQRPYLLRIARLQLRNESVAEDVVQDTLIAALEGADRFAGNSAVRTWLVGILKHKIIDQIRRGSREVSLKADVADGEEGDFDSLFDASGHFAEAPRDWGNPERTLEQKRFYQVLEACLDGLSPNLGRIFMMREFLGLETEEICKDLDITPTNCWVMLYRARMGLRACLESRWFQGTAAA
jgi:RNA polymerase sigma-70 factor (ECF subfamily)